MSQPAKSLSALKVHSNGINVHRAADSRVDTVDLDNPGFGTIFADHMGVMRYEQGQWQQPEVVPYGEFRCPPSMAALHYGQSVFEGMKAFRNPDGTIRAFRPRDHFERLKQSCERMCIPPVEVEKMMAMLNKLVEIDRDWVPSKTGNALYIRPLIFGTDAFLGVRPSKTYQLFMITSPVGAYYDEGFDPVSLTTSEEYVRTSRGEAGNIKTACNYGTTLRPAQEAQDLGYSQVLWLDANEHRYIEEVGTMNIFFKIDGELVTPDLNGSILGGITRRSVIQLAHDWDIPVTERRIAIDEIFEAHENGKLDEVFGTGTAAVISPVGSIYHEDRELEINGHQTGPFTRKLYDELTGIQYGKKKDPHNWMVPLG